ncbi:hypothetical protein [Niabella ginsengisoli]|uniref:Cytochrome c domain-containing protein n=1 Tax=Niabella ginsengisoli TaxID=522298 RepID=A0ABS9SPM6_9BACT|nr:hypothetical protein [Niabella ginsengisoli]MCH5600094.1 hypothetical protein [Niabella ginsengisoli]
MKKIIIALISLTTFVIACSPKASKSNALAASIDAGGAIISSAKCTKCHHDETAHIPKHTFAEQEKLMLAMSKKRNCLNRRQVILWLT